MLIQAYQAQWVEQFQQISTILTQAIPIPVMIEHIGSTAVPGLAAKPIIDIDIVYMQVEDLKHIHQGLYLLNYDHHGDQGIPGREVFKRRPGSDHPVLDQIAHHLYVCAVHSAELKKHLKFRDYLREQSDAKDAYAALKYALAEESGQDRKAYARLKEIKGQRFFEQAGEAG